MLTLPAPTPLVDAFRALQHESERLAQKVNAFQAEIEAAQNAKLSIGSFVPLTRIELPELFKSAPFVDTNSAQSWAEQAMALRKGVDAARRRIQTSHTDNTFPLAHNKQVLLALQALLHNSGVPENVSFSGLHEDLFRFFDDGFDSAADVLDLYASQIQDLRNSGHSIGIEVPPSRPQETSIGFIGDGSELVAPDLARKPTAPQALAPASTTAPATSAALSGSLSTTARDSAAIRHPYRQPAHSLSLAPEPAPAARIATPALRNAQALSTTPAPTPSKSAGAGTQSARLEPTLEPSPIPSTKTTDTPLTAPVVRPRTGSVFRNNRDSAAFTEVAAATPNHFADEAAGEPVALATAQSVAVEEVHAAGVRVAMGRKLDSDISDAKEVSASAPAVDERRMLMALNRMRNTYSAVSSKPAAVLDAINLQHPTAKLGVWLKLCVSGCPQFLPQLKDALVEFKPRTGRDFGIVEELGIILGELDTDPHALSRLAFNPTMLTKDIPKAVLNDISEMLPALVKN